MRQRICPVCGHLESAGTEYCTECNAKTIEYDDGTGEPETGPEEADAWEEPAGRQKPGRKGSKKSGGGSRGVPLGGIGIVAVLVIVVLVFVNRNLSDSGEDSGSSGESSTAQSGPEDEDFSGGAEDGSLPGNEEEPVDGWEESYPEESGGEGQDGQESDTELPAEGIAVEEGVNSYELIVADVTWTQAYYDCLDRGGHLVRITTDAEYQAILQQIASEGKENIIFWLGGARNDDSGYYWIYDDGYFGPEVLNEDAKYASYWLEGEPSFHDDAAGVDETRICMFRLSSNGQWVWNDVPDDVLSVASFYSGKIGYICEYE